MLSNLYEISLIDFIKILSTPIADERTELAHTKLYLCLTHILFIIPYHELR